MGLPSKIYKHPHAHYGFRLVKTSKRFARDVTLSGNPRYHSNRKEIKFTVFNVLHMTVIASKRTPQVAMKDEGMGAFQPRTRTGIAG